MSSPATLSEEEIGTILVQAQFDSITDALAPIIHKALGEKYQNIRLHKLGGTRYIFLADYGIPGIDEERRIIKVDMPPLTEYGRMHAARGCTTKNEIQARQKLNHQNITKSIDFDDLSRYGGEGWLSVEEYFPAQSLEELIKEKGALKDRASFEKITRQILSAERHLVKENMLHRDLNLTNILVNENLDVKVTDLANRGDIGHLEAKYLPTAGGRKIIDPLIIGRFTGQERQYNQQSEMYAFGVAALYMLTGKYFAHYSPENGTAIRTDTKESLLTDGMLDAVKHHAALDDAIATIPNGFRRYNSIIRRCLTLNEPDAKSPLRRFKSIDELANAFEEAAKPTLRERFEQHKRKALLIGTSALALMGVVGGVAYKSIDDSMQAKISEAKKLSFSPYWVPESGEIRNSLVGLKVETENMFTLQQWPRTTYIHHEVGDKELSLHISPLAPPRQTKKILSPIYPGRAYIEGTEGAYFEALELKLDSGGGYEADPREQVRLDISKLHQGTYTLAVELYSPTPIARAANNNDVVEEINMVPGQVIARQRYALVIGEKARAQSINSLIADSFSSWISMSLRNPADYMADHWCKDGDATWEVRIPEAGYRRTGKSELTSNQKHSWCSQPDVTMPSYWSFMKKGDKEPIAEELIGKELTLQVTLKVNGKPIYHTGFPLGFKNPYNQIWKCSDTTSPLWKLKDRLGLVRETDKCISHANIILRIPDKEFYKTLLQYAPNGMPKSEWVPWSR